MEHKKRPRGEPGQYHPFPQPVSWDESFHHNVVQCDNIDPDVSAPPRLRTRHGAYMDGRMVAAFQKLKEERDITEGEYMSVRDSAGRGGPRDWWDGLGW